MTRTTPILRQPHRRRSNAEWDEIRRLYQAGATAKALVKEYGGTERSLYARARRDGWLRKDDPAAVADEGLTPREADAAVRGLGADDGVPGPDAACRALAGDASLGDAARAAAKSAIAMLRDGFATKAYAYARMAGTLERLARGAMGEGGDAAERGRAAALDFLRREVAREFGPEASEPVDD
ncbi:hypothetical protein [Brevundimonas sp.]|uniref:hypothetical protein n=1 Tax=Brevundimonas sp. TaxID=1871086 RepID=UPI002FCBC0B6